MTFPNNVLNVKLFLAAVTSRMLAAPLNSKYKTKEFEFYLKDISSDVLVIPAEGNACAYEAALLLDIPVCTLTQSEDGHTNTLTVKSDPAGKLKDATPTEASEGSVDDKALFLHTSGTTGMPKGVPLTHRNLMATVNNIATHYAFDSKDCGYLVMPLFHVHGLMCGLLAPLSTGGTVVLPGNGGAFSATNFWVDFVANECTWYTAVPSIHQILLLRAPQDYPASNPPKIRFIRSCSSSLAPVVMQRLEQTFHAPVIEAYAMSEAAHMMTSNPLPANGPTKPGSVGVGVNVELTIRDDANNEVAQGQTGEVCVKGPNVTAGYHSRPEANQEAFLGGWFHTGDQGYLDAEGYLFLTGRIKELINRGGEKISPVEVDGILLAHPKVGEAVSFAAPHEILGEVVAAAVVPKANEQLTDTEIIDYCKQQLSAFKVPTLVFVVDDFPRTATGKIQRRIVAKHFLEKKE
ncbi:hypothetical protein SARC_11199 [Sphaeroforma arctica JP610]|uniref:Peroxisomal-coenzyme A synthetase n=1 Tax=Sphaeroforma arctica JP610 TaxID=667725 RepID=A0A0L0FHN9_9EUKA|nr:hypothetical protein SARC_11199 [Sphaeroforma arctica JP610]KNC76294.1 hypothetical protein SARC_11199 [Sphaeroforma arctica JP610]|eukprot:XP_014150196.1 hypothetical protein SARC_11199 [Sphaeroforma arctica JP610]